ncbi:ABC transporter permease subunit [Tamlana haliotis]|uniref:ABC transporter permease subunit n=1 Tax=Pseudotamlana haliotis TaxID=2614804 RepID=A0A6N6MBZ1_9FLAO|nr:ABC transporter permease subunit [Tamlana haliotis]KAB1067726.1 ABC transporter permease subunit [Tamlana haliotis]
MILLIAKKEVKELLRNNRFRLVSITLLILLVFSMFISWNTHTKVQLEHQAAQDLARAQWESQGKKSAHAAGHYGTFAFKPIPVLSLIDNGLNKYLGVSVFLEAHRQNSASYKQITDQNDLARFADLSPAFVFIYLMPLLIILLGFNSFTTEKESGTLQLILSQGASKRKLVLGKTLGIWFALLLLLVPVFLLGFCFIAFSDYENGDLLRYALIIISLLIYYGVFIHLSIATSVWAKSSNFSLIILLSFWMISALLMPKLTADISKNTHKTPSAIAYQENIKNDLENGINGHDPTSEKAIAFKDSLLKAYQVKTIDSLPVSYSQLLMQEGEKHETTVYKNAMTRLNNVYLEQLKVHQLNAFISPTILIRMLSMEFAKSDLQSHYNFTYQAEEYRGALISSLNSGPRGAVDSDFFKENIKFEYQSITLAQTMKESASNLLYLILWWLLSGMLVMLSVQKNKLK